jgi:hypothetical protein
MEGEIITSTLWICSPQSRDLRISAEIGRMPRG